MRCKFVSKFWMRCKLIPFQKGDSNRVNCKGLKEDRKCCPLWKEGDKT